MPHRRKHALNGIAGAQMIPVLGRQIVEGQQRCLVFDQAFARLGIAGGILLGKHGDGLLGGRPVGREINLTQVRLHPRLHGFWHLVEHVGRLVNPAALMFCSGKTSSRAVQKPSAPSPTASSGAMVSPWRFTSTRSSRQLSALSRTPTWKPTSSFLPSWVAPISTSMHSA